jgi:hypothetical protein
MNGAQNPAAPGRPVYGVLEFIKPIGDRYRGWFKLFWYRGDAAFAKPEIYAYCKEHRITFLIRLPSDDTLDKLVAPHLNRPVGRPPGSGIQVKVVDWLIKRLIKVGARVSCHARRWYVHVASAFPLRHHYRALLAWGS